MTLNILQHDDRRKQSNGAIVYQCKICRTAAMNVDQCHSMTQRAVKSNVRQTCRSGYIIRKEENERSTTCRENEMVDFLLRSVTLKARPTSCNALVSYLVYGFFAQREANNVYSKPLLPAGSTFRSSPGTEQDTRNAGTLTRAKTRDSNGSMLPQRRGHRSGERNPEKCIREVDQVLTRQN